MCGCLTLGAVRRHDLKPKWEVLRVSTRSHGHPERWPLPHGDPLAISVKPLHPLFGAEIGLVDIGRPLDDSTFAEIRAAFEDYSLLLFRDQELDDDKQI